MTRNELTEALLGREISIQFVSIAEAVRLHDASIERVGGTPGARDLSLLESALHKPMQRCLYEGQEDLAVLAACLADGIAQNHAFLDGNKRTAFLACEAFLTKNGETFAPDVAEAHHMFVALAKHSISADDLAAWIRETIDAHTECSHHTQG